MKRRFGDLTVEFPFDIEYILDMGLECAYERQAEFHASTQDEA